MKFLFYLTIALYLPLFADEPPISPYLFETVNVITGEYCELQQDKEGVQRSFNTCDLTGSGWIFNVPIEEIEGVEYEFEEKVPTQYGEGLYIKSVKRADGKRFEYDYIPHPKERKRLIAKRKDAQGRIISVEYNSDGKVKAFKQEDGSILNFSYFVGKTVVNKSDGNKTVYSHNGLNLTAVEEWDGGKPYRRTTLFYDDSYRVTSKSREDGKGNIHRLETFTYDENGQVVEKALFGNLSGSCKAPIILDKNGRPTKNGIESYRINYLYSAVSPHLMKTVLYENGDRLDFKYDRKTHKKTAQLFTSHQGKTMRHFYLYDSDENLIEEREDLGDGTCSLISRYVGGTTESYKYDPETGEEMFLGQVICTFSSDGLLLVREALNSALKRCKYEEFTYDDEGNLIEKIEDGIVQQYRYNSKKQCVGVKDHNGNWTWYAYDNFGRKTAIIQPRVQKGIPKTTFRYNILDQMVTQIDAEGRETNIRYNCRGNPIEMIYADGANERYEYHLDGTKRRAYSRNGCYIDYKEEAIYSTDGSALEILEHPPTTNAIETPPDESPALIEERTETEKNDLNQIVNKRLLIFKNGMQIAFLNDALGKVVRVTTTDALGNIVRETTLTYDLVGNKIEERHENSTWTKWEYDSMNRVTAVIEKDAIQSYTYTIDGKLASQTNKDGVTLYFEYSERGDLIARKSSDNTVDDVITYDEKGRVIQAINHITGEVLEREYDGAGNIIKDGQMLYIYDAKGRRKVVTLPDHSSVTYHYEDEKLAKITRKDPLGKELYHQSFDYDEVGLCRTESTLFGSIEYSQDSMHSHYFSEKIKRDDDGKIISITTNGIEQTFSYTKGGEVIWEGEEEEIDTCRFDALGRLIEASSVHYSYDFFNRRTSRTDENGKEDYLYDLFRDVGTQNAKGEIINFRLTIPDGVDLTLAFEAEGRAFGVICNLTHSSCCLIDPVKNSVIEQYEYDAFSQTNSAKYLPWRYKSKRVDPKTDLIYFGKRDYSQKSGRFLTKDPLGTIDGPDQTAFCRGNPLNYDDPLGGFSIHALWFDFLDRGEQLFRQTQLYLSRIRNHLGYVEKMRPHFDEMARGVFSLFYLHVTGYFQDSSEVGVYGKGELCDNVRITLVNGIMNARVHYKESLTTLCQYHGGMNIHYVFDSSNGWSQDIFKAIMLKAGISTSEAKLLVKTWRKLIEEMGGVDGGGLIIHYAHSLGGSVTQIAGQYLTEEEKKMIRIITFGSASFFQDSGFESVTHYISYRDVAQLLSPIETMRSLFGLTNHITWCGSLLDGPPFVDHFMKGETYSKILRLIGDQFQETHL